MNTINIDHCRMRLRRFRLQKIHRSWSISTWTSSWSCSMASSDWTCKDYVTWSKNWFRSSLDLSYCCWADLYLVVASLFNDLKTYFSSGRYSLVLLMIVYCKFAVFKVWSSKMMPFLLDLIIFYSPSNTMTIWIMNVLRALMSQVEFVTLYRRYMKTITNEKHWAFCKFC